mgnify:CR=1 FL=1
MTEELKKVLADGLTGLGLSPTQGQIDQLALYCDRLLEKNQVMNLTAITDPADVVTLHFLDSAALLPSKVFGGKKVIDVGTGSGILAIAALRLGASHATGVDIDPKAEDIARENAGYNGFSAPEFAALTGNVLSDKKLMARLQDSRYDVVLVNIVADVIIGLAPVLPNFMNENTDLICSGILCDRLEEVVAAIRKAGMTVTSIRCGEEWRCITVKKEN